MVANHIHHALDQVRELQQKILDKQRFKGYSGPGSRHFRNHCAGRGCGDVVFVLSAERTGPIRGVGSRACGGIASELRSDFLLVSI